jgi:CheY-like chemotaxis protein
MKVLLVDDSVALRRALTDALGSVGLIASQLIEAGDGLQALAELEKLPDVDLVFSDWQMPRMDGATFISEARARGLTAPVIVVTTSASAATWRRARAVGATAFLKKPVDARRLADVLDEVLYAV